MLLTEDLLKQVDLLIESPEILRPVTDLASPENIFLGEVITGDKKILYLPENSEEISKKSSLFRLITICYRLDHYDMLAGKFTSNILDWVDTDDSATSEYWTGITQFILQANKGQVFEPLDSQKSPRSRGFMYGFKRSVWNLNLNNLCAKSVKLEGLFDYLRKGQRGFSIADCTKIINKIHSVIDRYHYGDHLVKRYTLSPDMLKSRKVIRTKFPWDKTGILLESERLFCSKKYRETINGILYAIEEAFDNVSDVNSFNKYVNTVKSSIHKIKETLADADSISEKRASFLGRIARRGTVYDRIQLCLFEDLSTFDPRPWYGLPTVSLPNPRKEINDSYGVSLYNYIVDLYKSVGDDLQQAALVKAYVNLINDKCPNQWRILINSLTGQIAVSVNVTDLRILSVKDIDPDTSLPKAVELTEDI